MHPKTAPARLQGQRRSPILCHQQSGHTRMDVDPKRDVTRGSEAIKVSKWADGVYASIDALLVCMKFCVYINIYIHIYIYIPARMLLSIMAYIYIYMLVWPQDRYFVGFLGIHSPCFGIYIYISIYLSICIFAYIYIYTYIYIYIHTYINI